jgi:hypothetical protein
MEAAVAGLDALAPISVLGAQSCDVHHSDGTRVVLPGARYDRIALPSRATPSINRSVS